MSIEHILQRQASVVAPLEPAGGDADNVEELKGWALLRGQRDRALTLELRKRDDTVLGVPYVTIEQFLYSPADGITLRAAGREIRICGRGLNEPTASHPLTLFSALTRHRVLWVAEKSRAASPHDLGPLVVESIVW